MSAPQFTTWYSHVTDKFHAVSRFPARYATGRGDTPEQALAAAEKVFTSASH